MINRKNGEKTLNKTKKLTDFLMQKKYGSFCYSKKKNLTSEVNDISVVAVKEFRRNRSLKLSSLSDAKRFFLYKKLIDDYGKIGNNLGLSKINYKEIV